MEIFIPKEAEIVLTKLEKAGFEAFLVGGCVRDSLLGFRARDWDLVTSAKPQQIKAVFEGYRIIETGIKYGTVTLLIGQQALEITTYRVEASYTDGRHPDEVEFVESLQDDLKRRDFTINALAYHPQTGLMDYFGGLADLKNKTIVAVGEPKARFEEDSLRIMRALRFAAVYGFNIDTKTIAAMLEHKDLLKRVAPERIRPELEKLLCGATVKKVLKDYYPILGVIIPEILPMVDFDQHNPHHHLNVWEHTLECLAQIKPQAILRLAALLHDIGKPGCFSLDNQGVGHFYGHNRASADITKGILIRLKFDNKTTEKLFTLVRYHDSEILKEPKYVKRWLNRLGEENLRLLLELKRADALGQAPQFRTAKLQYLQQLENILAAIIREGQCFSLKHLAVNGNDLLQLGIPQGKQIGIMLDQLLKAVINEEAENDRDKLLQLAKKEKPCK